MEQELTNMLELLRQGLSELPAIGSDVFNIYVRGTQIEGGMRVATYVTVILILICLIRRFKKKLDNLNSNDFIDYNKRDDLEGVVVALSISLIVISVAACFGVYNGLMKLFAPEYMLIRQVINMLTTLSLN